MTDNSQPIRPDQGPFFVRSLAWGMWHRAGFAGYTADIDDAGVFEYDAARRYHDTAPHPRDVAVPVLDYVERLNRRVTELEQRKERLTELVARVTGCTHLGPRGYGE